jgi:hypothetical protein
VVTAAAGAADAADVEAARVEADEEGVPPRRCTSALVRDGPEVGGGGGERIPLGPAAQADEGVGGTGGRSGPELPGKMRQQLEDVSAGAGEGPLLRVWDIAACSGTEVKQGSVPCGR